MRDYNFFEAFYEEKKSSSLKFVYVGIIATMIVGAMVVGHLYTVFKINSLENEVASKEKILNSKELKTAAQKMDIAQKKLNLLNNYYDAVEEVNKITMKSDRIKTALIKKVSNQVPKEVSFQVMNISDNVTIQGTAANRTSIAEFEHNLKTCGVFDDVHVSNITSSEEGTQYSFNIICSFKEESVNESN
ncbi:PilN domain-containing protein [Clostridium ganghwense]|uniref:PilN domain-containing protein n=1 Tax=Clostridium ganghwense TaxID=312089 RepID=A0ABT4CPD2_9CLOT|nr:PilN domain-containing protein [Clostridium ganghwense]MCY6370911.1 PilN domain-containing protein [Clostridium ganghwense]